MTKVIPLAVTPRIALKRMMREANKEARELYRLTQGFWFLPLPPSEETQRMFEAGEIDEVPWLLPEDM